MLKEFERLAEKLQTLNRYRPLPDKVQKQLDDWIAVELTYASNAIEGSTLTRVETAEILERGVKGVVIAKPLKDQIEAVNTSQAIGYVRQLARLRQSFSDITLTDIQAIHRIILSKIDDESAGNFRETLVVVAGTDINFPHPRDVSYLMDEFIQWLNEQGQENPITVAAEAHVKLVRIHPFVDGNGRAARLLMNLILLIHSYPEAMIRHQDRLAYLEAIQATDRGDNQPFYAASVIYVERSLDAYLAAARGESPIKYLTAKSKQGRRKYLKIGELAKKLGETSAVIDHWTKLGLLRVSKRKVSGLRLYEESAIEIGKLIRELQQVRRLSLQEIKDYIKHAA